MDDDAADAELVDLRARLNVVEAAVRLLMAGMGLSPETMAAARAQISDAINGALDNEVPTQRVERFRRATDEAISDIFGTLPES